MEQDQHINKLVELIGDLNKNITIFESQVKSELF